MSQVLFGASVVRRLTASDRISVPFLSFSCVQPNRSFPVACSLRTTHTDVLFFSLFHEGHIHKEGLVSKFCALYQRHHRIDYYKTRKKQKNWRDQVILFFKNPITSSSTPKNQSIKFLKSFLKCGPGLFWESVPLDWIGASRFQLFGS